MIYMFAPLGNPYDRTRLVKFIRCYRNAGINVEFIGWARQSSEEECKKIDLPVSHILKGGGYGTKSRRFYPLWFFSVFLKALQLPAKSQVHALGWESAFPILIASFIKKHKIIFDDADRFSMILNLPKPLGVFIQFLERATSGKVQYHIIPSYSRYTWKNKTMFVIKNTPTSWDIKSVLKKKISKKNNIKERPLNVYINGWVGDTRGAKIFLEVFRKLASENRNIIIIFAGRVDSQHGIDLIELPNVRNMGSLSQKEALELYANTDVVITYYDPAIEINTRAESNKWGDCVAFNVPFIVNSEVETAIDFVENGCAWSIKYHDNNELYKLLLKLESHREYILSAKKNFSKLNSEYMVFDKKVEQLIEGLQDE
ncbi:hypothetical protein AB4528_10025 [Vibrio breoganii]